ncbi:MAG TPA: pilus assembly protein TadG-related protein [Xanthobacteraceae bacterium]|jgi:Flp pilus assembly protein TadG
MTGAGQIVCRFMRDTSGGFAPLFGLALIPIVYAAGIAVDYSMANKAKAKLDAIADTAALVAVNHHAMSSDDAAAQTAAQNTFNALAAGLKNVTVGKVNVSIADAMARTVTVSYNATTPTLFMGMTGLSTLNLSGQATAESGVSTYIDFYLLLDNTPSMGVGATPGDVATMVNNTPDQCAFACHDLNNTSNYYNLAKKLNVTMRIDVVRSATQQLTDTATSTANLPNQYRMAIYTFGASSATAKLTTIAALTSDLKSAKTAAGNIDLMTVQGQNQLNDEDTNYNGIMPAVDAAVPASGAGTQTAPQKVLFFVTDGVADENLSGNRVIEPIDSSLCSSMKSRGVKIAILYTTYLPLPTNSFYNQHVKPFVSNIGPSLQSCASPGLYFEVSPTQGISDAMTALFQKAVTSARLIK